MLILTRRIGEVIKIGHDMSVAILDIRGNQVSLAIDAPKNVPVHREEIYRRIFKDGGVEDANTKTA